MDHAGILSPLHVTHMHRRSQGCIPPYICRTSQKNPQKLFGKEFKKSANQAAYQDNGTKNSQSRILKIFLFKSSYHGAYKGKQTKNKTKIANQNAFCRRFTFLCLCVLYVCTALLLIRAHFS
jgi:hypothetical protein